MKLKTSLFAKLMACIFMLIFLGGSIFFAVLLEYMCFETQAYHDDYQHTSHYENQIIYDIDSILRYYELTEKEKTEKLSEEELLKLEYDTERLFPPAGTNIAWALLDTHGKVILSNLKDTQDAVSQVKELCNNRSVQEQRGGQYIIIGMRENHLTTDKYSRGMNAFKIAKHWFLPSIAALGICVLMTVVLFGFLVAAAGHKAGHVKVFTNQFDRIWVEVLLVGGLLVAALFYTFNNSLGEGVFVIGAVIIYSLIVFLSFVRRIKAGMFFKTSFLYFTISVLRRVFHHFPLMLRVIGILAAYILAQLILIIAAINGIYIAAVFCVFSNIALLITICIIAIQFDEVQKATERMAAGQFGQLIKPESVPFFSKIAKNINSTGSAMNLAVESATKSEHMKTELIANVSHDIKTPLTSIISYVDLLKTIDIEDKKAQKYINVLEAKSRRLAHLMTDLVEASKITTGNVSVNMEVINLSELIKQAVAEFETRLEQRGISLVCTLPKTPICVVADGRHMWRVLDNIFGNAAKYALDKTRVYVDVNTGGEGSKDVLLSIKNISRDALNIDPDELMERFVRGDKSRYTEGSGLGLSISKSLMELQGGTMKIFIDGDLFKVILGLYKADCREYV